MSLTTLDACEVRDEEGIAYIVFSTRGCLVASCIDQATCIQTIERTTKARQHDRRTATIPAHPHNQLPNCGAAYLPFGLDLWHRRSTHTGIAQRVPHRYANRMNTWLAKEELHGMGPEEPRHSPLVLWGKHEATPASRSKPTTSQIVHWHMRG